MFLSFCNYAHAEKKGRKPKNVLNLNADKTFSFYKNRALRRCIFSLYVSVIDNVRLVKVDGAGMKARKNTAFQGVPQLAVEIFTRASAYPTFAFMT